MNKRRFLRSAVGASLGLVCGPAVLAAYANAPASTAVEDETFWAEVRAAFRLRSDYINLENGFYCFQPETILEAFVGNVRAINFEASHYMRTRRDDDKLRVRSKLAAFAGCLPDELIVTRNTTESLDTIINAFDWQQGDEAIMANQDYVAMVDMFKLQARRHGMVNRLIDIPRDPQSDGEIVQLYASALTPRTRLIMISHMVNITGHILPVRAICDMAHAHGVQVLVDGAHTLAHLDFRIPDLRCDYFGASLHKWLCAPLGAGVLYVRRDRVAKLWPIFADESVAADDIRKLNHTGTHPVHTDLTIEHALAFQEMIGSARKEARLRYLQRYWTERVRGVGTIVMNTPKESSRSCAIANVGVRGIKPHDLARTLFDSYNVFTAPVDGYGVHGVRVTPQVFTSTAELDVLVHALKSLAA